MGLYLCIVSKDKDKDEDGDSEIAGWQLGRYSDFGCFRDIIARHLGTTDFPILMEHSDCDGEWSVAELPGLILELEEIGAKFRTLPPEEPETAFEHPAGYRDAGRIFELERIGPQAPFAHTAEYREGARSLYECFHNVDGENLFGALITLAREGIRAKRPISFD